MSSNVSSATRAVRASIESDSQYGAVVPPLHLSSNFAFEGFGAKREYDYTRSGNPTRDALAEALAALEGGAGAVVTASGMAALTLVTHFLKPGELLEDDEAIAGYSGTLFWGGPVHMDSLRALLLTNDPPAGAEKIIESVYLVSFEDALEQEPADPAELRLFIGYAGWAPGQLDYEMARGSWRVLPATGELVFAEAPEKLWQRLAPAQEQRATVEPGAVLSPGDTCEPGMRVGGQWSHGNT